MNILITGGAGFIGSHLIRHFVNKYPNYNIFNIDALTYAGNLENIKDVYELKNHTFIEGDITNKNLINSIFKKNNIQAVIHLAAESHVDNSIKNPSEFLMTNVVGTVNLLNAFIDNNTNNLDLHRFYHVSTDEVYGSLGEMGLFTENTPYDPRSPYSASKASSDHFVRAYGETYGLKYVISNCSNNYGEYQYPEKLIPLFIDNIINKERLPVYGDGNYTRDWLYVKDHVSAIDLIFHHGNNQNTYNIGGFNEWKNIDLVRLLCDIMDKKLGRKSGYSQGLIHFVKDRPGHDKRYAIDASKINKELGWFPSVTFEQGLLKTVDWFIENKEWINIIKSKL